MPYKFLEHTADALFVVEEKTLEGLFAQAALALSEIAVNLKTVEEKEKKELFVEGDNEEKLLFNFLQELIFLKDVDLFIGKKFDVKIEKKDKLALSAVIFGETLDPAKHELHTDAKSITYHQFFVENTSTGWKAQVLVDI